MGAGNGQDQYHAALTAASEVLDDASALAAETWAAQADSARLDHAAALAVLSVDDVAGNQLARHIYRSALKLAADRRDRANAAAGETYRAAIEQARQAYLPARQGLRSVPGGR